MDAGNDLIGADASLTCKSCKDQLKPMEILGTNHIYPCFRCLWLHRYDLPQDSLTKMCTIKRKSVGNWQIGTHAQLTKNKLWEEELERMFALWISGKVLE